jgi:hypothetical protein
MDEATRAHLRLSRRDVSLRSWLGLTLVAACLPGLARPWSGESLLRGGDLRVDAVGR